MIEWLSNNLWAIWLTLSVGLASAEMLTLDLTLLMLAAGALAGCVTAVVLPGLVLVQVAVAIVTALSMLIFLRPSMLKRFREAVPGYRGSSQIIGASGRALGEITATTGQVRINGETWSAVSYDPEVMIAPGEEVEVFELDGVTARVYPKNRPLTS